MGTPYWPATARPFRAAWQRFWKRWRFPRIPQDQPAGAETAGQKAAPPSHARRLLNLLALHRGTVAAVLGVSLFLNLLGLAVPRFTQAILDSVIPTGDLALLTRLMLVLTLVTTFQISLAIWRRLTIVRFSLHLDRVLLGEFCAHVLALPVAFFRLRRAGDIVARFNDHQHVRHLCASGLPGAVLDTLMVTVYFAVMFHYSVRLTLLVLAILVLFAGYTFLAGPVLKRQHRRLLEDKAAHESCLLEVITGIDVVKSMALERATRHKWEGLFEQYLATNYRTQKLRELLEAAGTGIKFLSTAVLLWYGAALVVDGQLSTGQLVALSMYTTQALLPLVSLITLWDEVQQARVSLGRMQEVLDHEPEFRQLDLLRTCPQPIRGYVRFEDVVFRYDGDDSSLTLRGVNFEIRPGERLAIVGRSGSGKTTLARLLLGLYRPVTGRILVDGEDVAQFDPAAYRQQLGVVLQENLLLAGTITDNIALGESEPDRERVIGAARRAGVHEFIAALPRAYETEVGELGLTLSGGQRQQISMARALYREPCILILDEATGALDSVSEGKIQETLGVIAKTRTVLIIAHKIATVRDADRILVLQGGVITEQGTHDELMAQQGSYYQLAVQQVGDS